MPVETTKTVAMTAGERRAAQEKEFERRQREYWRRLEPEFQQIAEGLAARDAQQAKAEADEREAEFKAAVRAVYSEANGGQGDQGFDDLWPDLRAAIVRQQVLDQFADQAPELSPIDRALGRLYRRQGRPAA
jgi:hypothetical protein